MSKPDILLCHPVRADIGSFNGSLKTISATALGPGSRARRCGEGIALLLEAV